MLVIQTYIRSHASLPSEHDTKEPMWEQTEYDLLRNQGKPHVIQEGREVGYSQRKFFKMLLLCVTLILSSSAKMRKAKASYRFRRSPHPVQLPKHCNCEHRRRQEKVLRFSFVNI